MISYAYLMTTAYFISDAHFGAGTPAEEQQKQEHFFSFLSAIASPDNTLYILGDLFDFWFEYNHAIISHHYSVLHHLSNAIAKGLKITYTAGNHDFWLGSFLTDTIGIDIEPDTVQREIQGKHVFFTHGDGLIPGKDNSYKILKRILRNPLNIRLFKLIHPDLGMFFANNSASISRRFLSKDKKIDFSTEYRTFAVNKFNHNCDAVLLGHSHHPLLEDIDGKTYGNTGNWIKDYSYIMLQQGKFTLKNWG